MKSVTELRQDCAEELSLEWQSLNQKQEGDYGVYRAVSATQTGLQPIFFPYAHCTHKYMLTQRKRQRYNDTLISIRYHSRKTE